MGESKPSAPTTLVAPPSSGIAPVTEPLVGSTNVTPAASATAMRGTLVTVIPASAPLAMAESSWVRCAVIAVVMVTRAAPERSCCSYAAAVPPRIRASWPATNVGSVTSAGSATSASTVPASATSARPGRLKEASRVPLAASSDTSPSPGVAATRAAPSPVTQSRSTAAPADASGTSVTRGAPPVPPAVPPAVPARRSPALTAVSSVRMSPDAVPTKSRWSVASTATAWAPGSTNMARSARVCRS